MTSQQSKPTVDETRSVDWNGEKAVYHREKPSCDPKIKGVENVAKEERGETANRTRSTDRLRNYASVDTLLR